jgi:hypothetical protein
MKFAVFSIFVVLVGCAQTELIDTREGMAACDQTIHADYVARVNADPKATATDKAAAIAPITEYNILLAESRKQFPAPAAASTQP